MQLKNNEDTNIKDYETLNSEDIKEDNTENNHKKIDFETEDKTLKKAELFISNITDNNKQKCYEQKKSLKKGLKQLLNGIFYCLFQSSIYFYYVSLEGCKSDELSECLVNEQISNYVFAGIELVICCSLFSIVLLIQILLKLTKLNYIIFIIPYIILFKLYHGVDLKNHGTYNSIAFLVVVPILTLFFYIIYYTFYSLYTKKFIRATIILSIFGIFFIIYFFFSSCDDFYKGIGGVDLENNRTTDKCYMTRPNYCRMKFIAPFFDMSKYKGGCQGRWNTKKRFLKHLDKNLQNINHFYYPRIEYADVRQTFNENLFNYVFKHIGGVKENPAEAEKAEVFVDFENDIGKITINVKRNETLVEERQALAEKNEVKFDNVYVFFIDHISRNHFLRRMKKLTKAFEDMLYSKKVTNPENENVANNKYKKFNSFQFIKLQSFRGATPSNMFPLFYGVPLNDNTGVSATKLFKEKGFITANTINSCYRDLYFINNPYIQVTNFDHENSPMFCDTNLIDPDIFWAYEQGENAIFRKCLYGKDSHEYMFEYMTQFLEAYKDQRKYMRLCFEDAHESTMHVAKYLDGPLTNFLNLIIDKYSDNKTAIIFLSDHGGKLIGPQAVLFVEQFFFEELLGSLFLLLPENNTKYDKDIVLRNEKRLLSNYDIYHTMLDYINVDKSEIAGFSRQYGQSLLTEIDGMKRDCETIGMKDCYCHNYE